MGFKYVYFTKISYRRDVNVYTSKLNTKSLYIVLLL